MISAVDNRPRKFSSIIKLTHMTLCLSLLHHRNKTCLVETKGK